MDDALPPAAAAPPPPPLSTVLKPIAPWWHTVLLVLMFVVWAIMSHLHGTASFDSTSNTRLLTYTSQIWISWILLGATVAGLYHRRTFFRITLTQAARSWSVEFRRGAAAYVGLYVGVAIAVGVFAAGQSLWSNLHPSAPSAPSSAAASSQSATKPPISPLTPPPEPATARTSPHNLTHLFDNKAVRSLAPRTLLEMLFWTVLSFTAGFVEEHVFRGYLLWQARAGLSRIHLPRMFSTALAVTLTSILFGILHLYEGIGAACFITCLGALYSVLALRFANLRAVIIAHFLQDFIAGLFIFTHSIHGPH